MFNASLQEILARYSDPSRNPYARVLRSQPSEPRPSQHLAQPLHPGLDLSFDVPTANQWRPKLRLDTETVSNNSGLCGALLGVMQAERSPDGTLQVLDSRGCYIQSLSLRTRSQPRVQQVLPAHPSFVTSSHGTNVGLCAVSSPVHGAASLVEPEPFVSDVAPRLQSSCSHANRRSNTSPNEDATNVLLTPASTVEHSASGSHADPIIIADISHVPIMPEISRPAEAGNMATDKEKRMEKGEVERMDAEMMETVRHESATNEAKRTESEKRESTTNEVERSETESCQSATHEVETKRCESATQFEAVRTETETREPVTKEAERAETEARESATNETTTKKEPRASATTNTPKLLRIERKLNNKDLFMGSYRSESSSELRYPHECIAPKIGDVYIHCFKKEGNQRFQSWVRQSSRGMTIWENHTGRRELRSWLQEVGRELAGLRR